jgi:hypothetical protein
MKFKSMGSLATLTLCLAVLSCRSLPPGNQSKEARSAALAMKHPVTYVGLDREGDRCTYTTEFTSSEGEILIVAQATGLEARFSVMFWQLPLAKGFKEEHNKAIPEGVEVKSYDGIWFKWEKRETKGTFAHHWFSMKAEPHLVNPSSFEIKSGYGPVPVKTRTCTFKVR